MSKRVYLAGPLSDGRDPYAWIERAKEVGKRRGGVEFVNPYTLCDEVAPGSEIYQADVEAVRSCDALLLRRIDHHEVCGAYIESGIAFENDIPTVVWNDADSDVPTFLKWHANVICESLLEAVSEVADYE